MKPLSSWPQTARYKIVGVFTDIDDTLTTEGAITPDRVVYTGTHDNDTVVGWYAQASTEERTRVEAAFGPMETPHITLSEAALASPGIAAFIPVQDLLGLGAEARFNTPGDPQGNWAWRMSDLQLTTLAAAAGAWRQRLKAAHRLSA